MSDDDLDYHSGCPDCFCCTSCVGPTADCPEDHVGGSACPCTCD